MTDSFHSVAELDAANLDTGSQLRALGGAELARLGEDSLRTHLVDMAIAAHCRYAPLSGTSMDAFLNDRNHVRYPVDLVYEIGTMAAHQFAQPEISDGRCQLFLHPSLEKREADSALAVVYFVPVINYGKLIKDDHCLLYGATVSGMTMDAYYSELCRIAAFIGAPARDRGMNGDQF